MSENTLHIRAGFTALKNSTADDWRIPCFERTATFCEKYDNPAFDPNLETMPLDEFAPMVRRIFETPKKSIYSALL